MVPLTLKFRLLTLYCVWAGFTEVVSDRDRLRRCFHSYSCIEKDSGNGPPYWQQPMQIFPLVYQPQLDANYPDEDPSAVRERFLLWNIEINAETRPPLLASPNPWPGGGWGKKRRTKKKKKAPKKKAPKKKVPKKKPPKKTPHGWTKKGGQADSGDDEVDAKSPQVLELTTTTTTKSPAVLTTPTSSNDQTEDDDDEDEDDEDEDQDESPVLELTTQPTATTKPPTVLTTTPTPTSSTDQPTKAEVAVDDDDEDDDQDDPDDDDTQDVPEGSEEEDDLNERFRAFRIKGDPDDVPEVPYPNPGQQRLLLLKKKAIILKKAVIAKKFKKKKYLKKAVIAKKLKKKKYLKKKLAKNFVRKKLVKKYVKKKLAKNFVRKKFVKKYLKKKIVAKVKNKKYKKKQQLLSKLAVKKGIKASILLKRPTTPKPIVKKRPNTKPTLPSFTLPTLPPLNLPNIFRPSGNNADFQQNDEGSRPTTSDLGDDDPEEEGEFEDPNDSIIAANRRKKGIKKYRPRPVNLGIKAELYQRFDTVSKNAKQILRVFRSDLPIFEDADESTTLENESASASSGNSIRSNEVKDGSEEINSKIAMSRPPWNPERWQRYYYSTTTTSGEQPFLVLNEELGNCIGEPCPDKNNQMDEKYYRTNPYFYSNPVILRRYPLEE